MMSYKSKGLPWHNVCRADVRECKSAREVMEVAELDWNVTKCPIYAQMPIMLGGDNTVGDDAFMNNQNIYRPVDKAYATYRTDINFPLGVVKSKYEVVQNVDAFAFFDSIIGNNEASWESAGYCGHGEQVFVTVKLPNCGDVNGDKIDQYLVFGNSHDGTTSLDIMLTPIRVACVNLLNTGIDAASAHIKLRHTKSVNDRLEIGTEVLRAACQQAKEAVDIYRVLETIKMGDDAIIKFLIELNMNDKELEGLKDVPNGYEQLFMRNQLAVDASGISSRKLNTIINMYQYYKGGIAQADIKGTAWGAYNAVTGYYSHVANLEGDKRMQSLLYGSSYNNITKALKTLAA